MANGMKKKTGQEDAFKCFAILCCFDLLPRKRERLNTAKKAVDQIFFM